jgi:hypothetical protein
MQPFGSSRGTRIRRFCPSVIGVSTALLEAGDKYGCPQCEATLTPVP